MKKHFICYSDKKFELAKKRLLNEATSSNWFDSIQGFSPYDISSEFKKKHENVLSKIRGAGFWIWKFDIISQKLETMHENDILIYCDSGCSINTNGEKRYFEYIDMLLNSKDKCIISFLTKSLEKCYTTKEIYDYFNFDYNCDEIGFQILSGILIMKKSKNLSILLEEYQNVLNDNNLLFTDFYNRNQISEFKDNRHDQSVFSIIRKTHKDFNIFLKDETYFKNFHRDGINYPFWATRKKN